MITCLNTKFFAWNYLGILLLFFNYLVKKNASFVAPVTIKFFAVYIALFKYEFTHGFNRSGLKII